MRRVKEIPDVDALLNTKSNREFNKKIMPKITKKELKNHVNKNGFFYNMSINIDKNAPQEYASQVPDGATYFEGVVSNGELNRNGYKIRPQALIDSLAGFMLNPVIFLQHDTDEPIGHCLSAEVRGGVGASETQEIFVRGYIYDDLTGGRFSRNLFRGLSTGHIPLAVEFENSKTSQIISEEEFRKYSWEERCSGDWIMCVTKLDWVEFSLVGVGSVRKALVTSKNCIEAWLKKNKISEDAIREIAKNNEDKTAEDTKEVKEDEAGQSETGSESQKVVEGSENSGETPEVKAEDGETPAPAETESAPAESEGNKIRISKEDKEKLQNAANTLVKTLAATIADDETNEVEPEAEVDQTEKKIEPSPVPTEEVPKAENNVELQSEISPEIKNAIQALVDLNSSLSKENAELQSKLNKIPNQKGMIINSQFNTPEKAKPSAAQALVQLLKDAGIAK